MKKKIIYSILICGFIGLASILSNPQNFGNIYAFGAEWLNFKKEKVYFLDNLEISKETGEYFTKNTHKAVTGKVQNFWKNGKIRTEFTVRNGKRNGIGKTYHENGNLQTERVFENDKENGVLKVYSPKGILAGEIPYVDGQRHGLSKMYAINDIVAIYSDGTLMQTTTYDHGKKIGLETNYLPNGKKEIERFYLDDDTYDQKTYDESGKLIRYELFSHENGNEISVANVYDDKGQVEGHYKNGKLDGTVKTFYENGRVRIEQNYKDDKLNGVARLYSNTGLIWTEIPYKDGKINGIQKEYYPSGKLGRETPFNNDKENGISKLYTEKGKLCAIVQYSNGVPIDSINSAGEKLTSAEISNAKNGLGMSCY